MNLRRVRLLGLFQGWQQDEDVGVELPEWPAEPGLSPETTPALFSRVDREDPPARDPRYDPLSDWLDEPFPEELR